MKTGACNKKGEALGKKNQTRKIEKMERKVLGSWYFEKETGGGWSWRSGRERGKIVEICKSHGRKKKEKPGGNGVRP